MRCQFLAAALLAALCSTPALAQDAAESKADGGTQTTRETEPAEAGFVAKARRWAEEKKIAEKIAPREGVYARFGGMTTGSGFAVGPGYRRYFRRDDMYVDLSGALSTKAYKAFDARGRWARFWGDRVELWSEFRYRDYPEEDFFGLGENSTRANRTSYSIESTDIVGRGMVSLTSWLRVGADIGYFNPDVGHGADNALPSIEDRFTDAIAPGLADQPEFMHQSLFAEIDTRDRRGTPTRGGFYRAAFSTWEDVSLEQYDHHRFDAEGSHFFAVNGPKHVVGLRVGLSYVNNETGHRVPFSRRRRRQSPHQSARPSCRRRWRRRRRPTRPSRR
jgi:hypothetical protein